MNDAKEKSYDEMLGRLQGIEKAWGDRVRAGRLLSAWEREQWEWVRWTIIRAIDAKGTHGRTTAEACPPGRGGCATQAKKEAGR